MTRALFFSIGLLLGLSSMLSGFALAGPVTRLSEAEISRQSRDLPGWRLRPGRIERTFLFKNFPEAIAFIARLVEPAESIAHHPDITVHYNRVTLSLTTHDVGGLSQLDFDLARKIDRLMGE